MEKLDLNNISEDNLKFLVSELSKKMDNISFNLKYPKVEKFGFIFQLTKQRYSYYLEFKEFKMSADLEFKHFVIQKCVEIKKQKFKRKANWSDELTKEFYEDYLKKSNKAFVTIYQGFIPDKEFLLKILEYGDKKSFEFLSKNS